MLRSAGVHFSVDPAEGAEDDDADGAGADPKGSGSDKSKNKTDGKRQKSAAPGDLVDIDGLSDDDGGEDVWNPVAEDVNDDDVN